MSLLTLQSTDNAQNPTSTDPAIIRNNFKDGIELRKGTEVGLVSLSINKIAVFEVVEGVNDTFTWRIGARTQFNQHRIVVPAGEYTGEDLARIIVEQLNNSTILGNFKGAWTCSFDASKFDGDGAFTIDYGQNPVPDFNQNTCSLYAGNPAVSFEGNGTGEVIINGAEMSNEFQTRGGGNNIITSNVGIFPNDGEVVYTLQPIKGFPLASFTKRFITDAIQMEENNGGTTRTFTLMEPAGGSDAKNNDWTYVVMYDNGDANEYWYFDDDDEGHIGIGSDDTSDATDSNNWDISEVFYNETTQTLQDLQAGARYATTPIGQAGTLHIYQNGADPKLGIPKVGMGYGTSKLGWVRNQLYNGKTNYPTNPDAFIKTSVPDGFDCMFVVKDNANFDNIQVSLNQMNKNGAIDFPNPNWRNQSKNVFGTKTPQTWNTIAGTNPPPSAWTNFEYGKDHIQVKIQISNITNMKLFILHDKDGDKNYEEQQMLITMAQANNNITKNIIEDFYPLRPCFVMINGGRYERKTIFQSGRFDSEEIQPPLDFEFQGGEEMDDDHPDYVDLSLLKADPPSNAVSLSSLFIFGTILDADLVSNGGTFPDQDAPTPASRVVNQISSLIGFNNFNIYSSGQVSNPTTSQHKPLLTIREPNLLVELVDFNIKGYNGATGDRGKIIASIPAEELSTNSRTGTLNYFSQYPIMIDLNLVNDTIVYDLNVIIRRPNGRVADDLIPKTAMTLLFKEGEETKQRRMMKEQVELIASSMSNINQIKTDSVGNGFPKL